MILRRFTDALFLLVATLWVGSLWAIGYIAAPVIFSGLADRAVAGILAGRLFAVVGWIGLGGGLYMLLFLLWQFRFAAFKQAVFWGILAMLLLSAAQIFGLQPLIAELRSEGVARELVEAAARSRFATWHGVASGLYLLQSLLGVFVVLRLARGLK